jgi:four helix bundle protein
MNFDAYDVSLELVRELKLVLAAIRTHDRNLESQIREAGTSIPLNFAEGRRRAGKDRNHHYRIAAGSADEVRAGLQVADAWGYIAPENIARALELIDRILAMAWRLTRS